MWESLGPTRRPTAHLLLKTARLVQPPQSPPAFIEAIFDSLGTQPSDGRREATLPLQIGPVTEMWPFANRRLSMSGQR